MSLINQLKLIIQFKIMSSIDAQGFFSVPCFQLQQDQNQPRSYNPFHTNYLHESKSQHVIPLTQKKSNTNSIKNDDDKSFIKNQLDLSQTFQIPHKSSQKPTIIVKNHRSLIPEIMNRRFKSGRTEITVYYFNTNRRITFPKAELSKKFALDQRIQSTKRQLPLIKYLIPYLIKQYCQLFLNFQPLEVKHENFQLKLANLANEDDPLIDPFSHEEEITWLFECASLVLVRKEKDYERLKVWQKKISPDMEVVQIIIPSQREIIQQVQKNRSLNSLKQKLTSYNQLGNIVIVTYNSFTICEPKKKISEIVAMDRILQVYRLEVSTYEDIETSMRKQKAQLNQYHAQPIIYPKQSKIITDSQFEVNQSFYYGKLYIQILGSKIIEKYEGGFFNYFFGTERRIERSVHTLVGISCEKATIKMKFLTKYGTQLCSYQFQSKNEVQAFFKCILKIGRELKQNFQKISK